MDTVFFDSVLFDLGAVLIDWNPRYLYRPLIRRDDYVHEQSRNLIDRLFGGRIAPFITQFSERQDLSDEEIEELKRLLRRLDHDR